MLVFITFVVLVVLTAFPKLLQWRGDHSAHPSVGSFTGDETTEKFSTASSDSQGDVNEQDAAGSKVQHAITDQRISLYLKKPLNDWVLDGLGLLVQGVVIPILQITAIYNLWSWILPSWEKQLVLPGGLQLLISVALIDYLYYWNHRLLHSPYLWWVHQVHHTVTDMDVLGTSRNTIWSSFFIVYLWVHALMIYCISDPSIYMLGVSLTSALDLWRHSALSIPKSHWLFKALDPWLILPHDHAQHHSTVRTEFNFGANLKFWDKIHKTYHLSSEYPRKLGVQLNLSLIQKLVLPLAKHH